MPTLAEQMKQSGIQPTGNQSLATPQQPQTPISGGSLAERMKMAGVTPTVSNVSQETQPQQKGILRSLGEGLVDVARQPATYFSKVGSSIGAFAAKKLQNTSLGKSIQSGLQNLTGITPEEATRLQKEVERPNVFTSTDQNYSPFKSTKEFTGETVKAAVNLSTPFLGGGRVVGPALDVVSTVLSNFGKKLIPRAIEFGAGSAGLQLGENLSQNKPSTEGLGTAFLGGAALPVAGTALGSAAKAVKPLRNSASERIINSFIKPLQKDLSYGKNPGRGVAAEGLVFNNLEEGAQMISQRRNEVGQMIGEVLRKPENQRVGINLGDSLNPIDEAITRAKQSPRTNSALIERLENVKKDLLGLDANGKPTRNFVYLNPEQATEIKMLVGDITKFTGNVSDDNVVNGALKKVYGKIKGKINEAVPEVAPLNERYADLTSADIAIRYRDKIEQRMNLIGAIPKLTSYGLGGFGIVTMNPAALALAIGNFGVDKLLSSAAFKTRFAKFLSVATKAERESLIQSAPAVKSVLDRIFGEGEEKLPPKEIEKRLNEVLMLPSPRPASEVPIPLRGATEFEKSAKKIGAFQNSKMRNDREFYGAIERQNAEQFQQDMIKQAEKDAQQSAQFTGQQEMNYYKFEELVKKPQFLNPKIKEAIQSGDVETFKNLAEKSGLIKNRDIFGVDGTDNEIFDKFRERLLKDNPNIFGGEKLLPKFRVLDELRLFTEGKANISKERAKQILSDIFPDDNVGFFLEGTVKSKDGTKILGKYANSMIELLEQNGKVSDRTVYHEAFHKYLDLYMPKEEKAAILKEATIKYADSLGTPYGDGKLNAEEILAEMFSRYARGKDTFTGRLLQFFQQLVRKIQSWSGKQNQIMNVWDDILAGKAKGYRRKTSFGRVSSPTKFSIVGDNTDLLSEAKKYKSVDEFVKSQPTYYHGTSVPDKILKEGFKGGWITDSPEIARKYGKVVDGQIPDSLLIDARTIEGDLSKENLAKLATKNPGKLGVIDKSPTGTKGENLVFLFEGKKFLTKKDLVNIWNKANKKTNIGK